MELPNGIRYEQPTGIFYNNEFHRSKSGRTFATVNPSTGIEICQVQESQSEDIDEAVRSATTCLETSLETMTPADRGNLLYRFADLIVENRDILAAIESADGGKPYDTAHSDDLGDIINVFRYYAGWADKIQGRTIDTGRDRLTYTLHEPVGVCGQIIPWNFPLSMFGWKVAPAFACGNPVVLKPAEQTPLSVLYLAKLVAQIFPSGAINIVPGFGKSAGAYLASHPDVRKVAFTGSTTVGRSIMQACSKSAIIKKVTLELGGKSPLIILEDADLHQAVRWSHSGMFYNQAQVCCATTRILVQESVYDKFCRSFRSYTQENKRLGLPFAKGTFQGPQISQLQTDKILDYIESGKEEGAILYLEGGRSKVAELKDGYFIEPTIFTNVTSSMRIFKEEIFGPVACITPFSTQDEAVKLANDTQYGLGAAVFTTNIGRGHRIARKLQAGQVWINSSRPNDTLGALHLTGLGNDGAASIPFGGYKNSGIGRELGEYALSNYTEVKSVMVNLTEE